MTLEKTISALHRIRQLSNAWPTVEELRANRGASPLATPGSATPKQGTLPYGLGNTYDTPGHPKTRDGIASELAYLAHTVASIAHTRIPPRLNYDTAAAWLIDTLPRTWERLPEVTRATLARATTRYQHITEQQTGHGSEPTRLTCPTCATQLARPYTDEGISPVLLCETGHAWTRETLLAETHSHATHTLVTQTQAATILGIKLGTINARIRRRKISPTTVNGSRGYYKLSDLT